MSKQTAHIYNTYRGWIIRTEFRLSGYAACVAGRCFAGRTRARAIAKARDYIDDELTPEPDHAS